MSSQTFRVIISGGGVCGLTLANALERGRIEYTLLESRDEIAPALGASIAINANGFRILDQLGCYDHIESKTAPFDYIRTYLPNGQIQRNIDAPMLTHKRYAAALSTLNTLLTLAIRLGYPFTFMDRQFLLQTLYDNLGDKSKVLLNKRVSRVEQGHEGVTVYCRDGTSYKGDVVVGADGIHSVVREEMWRYMSAEHGKLAESERSGK
jgi:2-polyprenyl-6-methoxyphenol hydroxylase-like FAD-dependent oxidoreductase